MIEQSSRPIAGRMLRRHGWSEEGPAGAGRNDLRYLAAMTLWFGTAQDAQVPSLGASGLTGVRNVRNEIGFVFDVDPADVNPLLEDALDQLEITG